MKTDTANPADIVFGALCEIGRRDLGLMVQVFTDVGGPYVEMDEAEIMTADDWALVDRAETVMRRQFGFGPMNRPGDA